MEKEPAIGGMLFRHEGYMSVIRDDREQSRSDKQSDNNRLPVYGVDYNNVLRFLQNYCKIIFNKNWMAEIKFGWLFIHIVGIPVYIFGIIDNLDNYKSAVLFLMGLMYSCTVIYRSYQKGRKEKISNDREEFHLLLEKEKSGHQTKH